MEKVFVLLGCPENEKLEEFRARYLDAHKDTVLAADVERYIANLIEEPGAELQEAGWGFLGKDTSGIEAIDEVWTNDVDKLIGQYKSEKIIAVYRTEEHVLRPVNMEAWPLGEKTFWIKRITLMTGRDDLTLEEFFHYWQNNHGPLACKHHIGAGIYIQNNVMETPVKQEGLVDWTAVVELQYWNVEAFKYGHFSRKESSAEIKADIPKFIGKAATFLASEYIQKA